eukprot:TRINITY_DN3200_c0_g1_i1.p1 TRINITY_DN3200_c0_g1~~TRINITY_DN3200_c0_g1_i1.p1  ORF type:complete len:914 (+),score=361.44 TRINITY_DN3200_c0_g1_i1:169-2742(+)
MSAERVLLPTDVKPRHYKVHLTPDLVAFTFKGEVEADVDVKRSTSTIVVHSVDQTIKSVEFVAGATTIAAKEITLQAADETATFAFGDALPVGAGKLRVAFDGNLNDKMVGFYRSFYTVDGQKRPMATTQFEATDARRAFPCWDEPAVKATFEIVLSIPSNLNALSNMPVVSESVSDGVKTLQFGVSPIMSTYLVAFVVGEFDYVEGTTKEGVVVRVYTPPGKKELGTFALNVGVKTLSYFTEYFGVPYPLPKLDMIAVADFAAGAMENWGLVTYRETALLVDAANSGVASKQRVAYVVGHELAHQWFGNLVTMEWWKELWLNEGFATFVGNQAVDHLFPEWDRWTDFVSDVFNKALQLDALANSHPIEVDVKSSAEINEIFDAISYNKGASVIRMISEKVGEANFRKGLNIYLHRHKYSNAVTEDLWQALSEASGFPVKEFMDAYTKSTGYALVKIESTGAGNEFAVEQTRFFADGKTEPSQAPWWISLPLRTADSDKVTYHDLKTQKATLQLPNADAAWLKANAGQAGFFRVLYDGRLSDKLRAAVESLALPTVDRLGLQNDAFALAKAGHLPTSQALALARAYVNETSYLVWSDLIQSIGEVDLVWSNEPNYPQFQAYLRSLLKPVATRLGWDAKPAESDLDKLLRTAVLNELASQGDPEVIAEGKRRFAASLGDASSLPADIRLLVYKIAVMSGGAAEFDAILNVYRTAELHEDRVRALRALGYASSEELLIRNFEFAISSEVRSSDLFYGFVSNSRTVQGRELAWKFLQSHWDRINEILAEGQFLFARLISFTTKFFASEQKAAEIEKFFADHPLPQAERTIRQSIEEVRANARWLERNRDDVAAFLSAQQH